MEDALHAARAAVEEGIVGGGGVALLRASLVLQDVKLAGDEQIGIDIIRCACEEPARQIAGNAGFEGAIVTEKIRSGKDNFGFNAASGVYEDLITAGAIDPAKVTRSALQIHRTAPLAYTFENNQLMGMRVDARQRRFSAPFPVRFATASVAVAPRDPWWVRGEGIAFLHRETHGAVWLMKLPKE